MLFLYPLLKLTRTPSLILRIDSTVFTVYTVVSGNQYIVVFFTATFRFERKSKDANYSTLICLPLKYDFFLLQGIILFCVNLRLI